VIPESQPASQHPPSQLASPHPHPPQGLLQQAEPSSGVQLYSHSGQVYFFFFSTLTVRTFAPLLMQLLHPLPSQELHEWHFFFCQGKTTHGMQIFLHSTSKHDFSTSTISASNLQVSQLCEHLGQQAILQATSFKHSPASALGACTDAIKSVNTVAAEIVRKRFMRKPSFD
jgi:hypothetical protein